MKMKLSEAILFGSMITEPTTGDEFFGDHDGVVCRACAYGAAWVALVGTDARVLRDDGHPTMLSYFPILKHKATCPVCTDNRMVAPVVWVDNRDECWSWLANVISHLFEEHHWSRERIAAWVATIEEQSAITATETPVATMVEVQ